jgi:hypothetical protein
MSDLEQLLQILQGSKANYVGGPGEYSWEWTHIMIENYGGVGMEGHYTEWQFNSRGQLTGICNGV